MPLRLKHAASAEPCAHCSSCTSMTLRSHGLLIAAISCKQQTALPDDLLTLSDNSEARHLAQPFGNRQSLLFVRPLFDMAPYMARRDHVEVRQLRRILSPPRWRSVGDARDQSCCMAALGRDHRLARQFRALGPQDRAQVRLPGPRGPSQEHGAFHHVTARAVGRHRLQRTPR